MLEIAALVRRFSGRTVLDGVTLGVTGGARLALHGPNGSGKTTLLRCALGTLTPDSGSVAVDGKAAGTVAARRLTGASLSQERSFYLRLTARENLLLFARLRGQSAATVDDLLRELELEAIAHRRSDRLSTGQLQQLAFVRALIGDPPLLLLDEPTRSLDSDARLRFWAALDRRPQAAVLFATHLDEDLEHATAVHELATTP